MRIIHLGKLRDRNKSALITRVALHKATDLLGECDGVHLWLTQNTGKTDEICLVDLVMSAGEAKNLSNRLDEVSLHVVTEEMGRRMAALGAKVDPFPGL